MTAVQKIKQTKKKRHTRVGKAKTIVSLQGGLPEGLNGKQSHVYSKLIVSMSHDSIETFSRAVWIHIHSPISAFIFTPIFFVVGLFATITAKKFITYKKFWNCYIGPWNTFTYRKKTLKLPKCIGGCHYVFGEHHCLPSFACSRDAIETSEHHFL